MSQLGFLPRGLLAGGAAAGGLPGFPVQAMQHGFNSSAFVRLHGLAEQGGRGALAGDRFQGVGSPI